VQTDMCTPSLAEFGSPELREQFLRPAIAGTAVAGVAITEPDAGSDAASIRTRAVRDGDGWIVTGKKHFISDGHYSDFFIVSAVTDPEARPRHVSLFLIDKDQPGVAVGRDRHAERMMLNEIAERLAGQTAAPPAATRPQ